MAADRRDNNFDFEKARDNITFLDYHIYRRLKRALMRLKHSIGGLHVNTKIIKNFHVYYLAKLKILKNPLIVFKDGYKTRFKDSKMKEHKFYLRRLMAGMRES
ncbi:MAG: hypothetical protein QW292_09380, partial [Candidatus Parvarchaeota archaeon]